MNKLKTIQMRANLNEVYSLGELGPGGAYHKYVVVKADTQEIVLYVQYQKGPRKDPEAIHGVLDCDLLEMVRDRLKAFQSGEYACEENANALNCIEAALAFMNERVENRIRRNVLGTMEK